MPNTDPPTPCPICRSPMIKYAPAGGLLANAQGEWSADCPRCGIFHTTPKTEAEWKGRKADETRTAAASGWLRHNPGSRILTTADVDALCAVQIPDVERRGRFLLEEISRRNPSIGGEINFSFQDTGILPWLAVSYSSKAAEVVYLLDRYLRGEFEFIEWPQQNPAMLSTAIGKVSITPKGHAFLASRSSQTGHGEIGFCAMWFGEEVQPLWQIVIEPGIRDAGFDPVRIDKLAHNAKIDDQIIAAIRASRFVVADFTGQRGGVYYEAGFAEGLGIPVIRMVRRDQIDELHFDTRQYFHLAWDHDALGEAKRALSSHILATIAKKA